MLGMQTRTRNTCFTDRVLLSVFDYHILLETLLIMSFIVKKMCRTGVVILCVCVKLLILMLLDPALIAVVIKHEPLRGWDPSLNVNNTHMMLLYRK